MPNVDWRWTLDLRREDGTSIRAVPVEPDWDPCQEWLRFQAMRRGATAGQSLALPCTMHPRWDTARGAPFVAGVQGVVSDAVSGEVQVDFALAVFADAARDAGTRLVEEGQLNTGDPFQFDVLAEPRETETAPARKRLHSRPVAPDIPILGASLPAVLTDAEPLGGHSANDDMRVIVPAKVLDECEQLCREHEGLEVGGLLAGHLRRDTESNDLFVEVTAQLPARHTDASATRLTFTPDTWTDFRAALSRRGEGEIPVGWVHSHPVRRWCAKCPEERQRTCGLRGDFLSEDDRLLHRAIFPRAYGIALVVNDLAFAPPTFSLFGWRDGLLALRGFHKTGHNRRADTSFLSTTSHHA